MVEPTFPPGNLPDAAGPAPRDSTGQKVTGAISWTLLPRAIQILVSLVTSILIVRTLGEFDYGTLSVLRSILTFVVVVLGLGLGQALNRFIPELRVTDRRREGRGLLYRCLFLQSVLWAVSCLALLALRGVLRGLYPTYGDLLLLGVFLSLGEVAAGTVTQYAVASYRTREMALATALGTFVLGGGTVLLLHVGLRVPGVLIASAAGYVATAITLGFLLRRTSAGTATASVPGGYGGAGPGPVPSEMFGGVGVPWRRFLGYALPWVPNFLLLFVVWRQSETLLLGIFRSREEAGFFDLAYKLPMLVLEFVPSAIYPLVLAGFAETATVARERMAEVIETYYRLLFFVVAPLAMLGFAMGDTLLARMYGADMAQAGPYCQVFFLVFALGFFGTPLSMTVYVVEKVWVNLLLNVAYGLVVLGLDLLLIPRYGLLGATIPTSIVTVVTPFVRYAIARRYLKDIRVPWAFIGRAFLASAPLLALAWAKRWATGPVPLVALLLAAAAVTLVSYRWLRVLRGRDREFLRKSRIPARDLILRII